MSETEHDRSTDVANALWRDEIPDEQRGFHLAALANHVRDCEKCRDELKRRKATPSPAPSRNATDTA